MIAQTLDGYTRQIAEWVADLASKDISASTTQQVKNAVLDQLGAELLGSTVPWLRPIRDYWCRDERRGETVVAGMRRRLTPAAAALVNASYGHACEVDDFILTGGHPGSATVPVALALGSAVGASGLDAVVAVVAGYQAMAFVGGPVRVGKRGFHSQGTIGAFGAAASAAKILGLGRAQTANALGIAASYASGITEYTRGGGEVKRLHAGLAARAGVEAARLADAGLTAPATAIEGSKGFYSAFSDDVDEESIPNPAAGLAIDRMVHFKRYPCVIGIHSALDALSEVVSRGQTDADDISRIVVEINEHSANHGASITVPRDVVGAQFSLAYSLALRLVYGSNEFSLYRDSRTWTEPRIVTIARKVEVVPRSASATRGRFAATVTVYRNGGAPISAVCDEPDGHPARPLGSRELRDKFFATSAAAVSPVQADRVRRAVEDLTTLVHLGELTELTAGGGH